MILAFLGSWIKALATSLTQVFAHRQKGENKIDNIIKNFICWN